MIDEKKLIEALYKFDKSKFLRKVEFEKFINEQPKVDNWIPVSERLPDYDELVLATDDCYRVFIAWYSVIHGWCSDRYGCCYVVAWMPLPEPYEGD